MIDKFADVIINYSLALKPGEQLRIETDPKTEDFTLAVYREALKAGAHVFINQKLVKQDEIFYEYASEEQLNHTPSVLLHMARTFDAQLIINTVQNAILDRRQIDPDRIRKRKKASSEILKILGRRIAQRELKWCYTVYPTQRLAETARMSLAEFQEFVFKACKLFEPDPAQAWQEESRRQFELVELLEGAQKVEVSGPDIDLSLSVKGRRFIVSDGKVNMPDGEIYTSPDENSATGWVRFSYPAVFEGCQVEDVELWFEEGRVVREKATRGQESLAELLATDSGARILGELGIGTNYDIQQFTANMLFDEKMGGTMHLALGRGFPEAGGKNHSAIHLDLLCDMSEAEIRVDGELVHQHGRFVI